jgi:hypothetical protein
MQYANEAYENKVLSGLPVVTNDYAVAVAAFKNLLRAKWDS